MKNQKSILRLTVTVMLLATSLLLFVMLGGCGDEEPEQTQQTATNGDSKATTEPWGTVVISPTDDENSSGVIEIVIPNEGDGEEDDGDDVNGSTGSTGNTGNTGSTGNTGNTGNTGSTGNTGNTGSTGNTGNTGSTADPTEPSQSGNGNTNTTRPTDPTLPTQSGDGDTEQGNSGNTSTDPVGDADDEVDLEVDFDDLFN